MFNALQFKSETWWYKYTYDRVEGCVWIAFSIIFHEKITVAIWYMWGKKMIGKCDHGKRQYFPTETSNPSKALNSQGVNCKWLYLFSWFIDFAFFLFKNFFFWFLLSFNFKNFKIPFHLLMAVFLCSVLKVSSWNLTIMKLFN